MPPNFENSVKHKSTLTAVRNLATVKPGLKDAFAESMNNVITLVNSRFQRMKCKDEHLKTFEGVPEEAINESLEIVNQILHTNVTTEMNTADLRKVKHLQVQK